MNPFKRDPNYFLKYFSLNALGFGLLNVILFSTRAYEWQLSFNLIHLFLILTGLIFGLLSATAFHNASHGNIKPRLLNAIVGEFTASFSLEDFRCFKVGHMLHHMHVDDPELDPHPPRGLTFLEFIQKSRQKTIGCISSMYYKAHGKTLQSERNIRAQIVVFHIAAVLKLVFWFLLFGPVGFFFFYVPAFLSYFFGFAHLNYISHQDVDGKAEIHNHTEGLFYQVMNVLTSGGYYHKNHHSSPGLYNPGKLGKTSGTIRVSAARIHAGSPRQSTSASS